jgi:hypothetical protein
MGASEDAGRRRFAAARAEAGSTERTSGPADVFQPGEALGTLSFTVVAE